MLQSLNSKIEHSWRSSAAQLLKTTMNHVFSRDWARLADIFEERVEAP